MIQQELSEALKPLAEAEIARRKLSAFCKRVDPAYVLAPHILYLCDILEKLERNEIKNVMVLVPPRMGKTRLISQLFPAWWLGKHPRDEIILASNTADLAEDNSAKARNVMSEQRYPFGTRVAADTKAKGLWRTNQDGVLRAAGIGGAIQGRGANLLIVDDPVANAEEATDAAFDRQWRWFAEDAHRRLLSDSHVILAMFRWGEKDLAGRILADDDLARDWTVVSLPAYARIGDALGREEGEILWLPTLVNGRRVGYDREYLEAQRRIDLRSWAAMYELEPIPAGGAIFKPEWFAGDKRYKELPPETYTVPNNFGAPQVVRRHRVVVQAIDSAWKTGINNDYSVIATWMCDGVDAYLLDVWRKRVEFPDLCRAVIEQYRAHHPEHVLVEDAGSGIAILQELKRTTGIPLYGIKARDAKEARAQSTTGWFEAGKVKIPKAAPWLKDWVEEHLRFPGGFHDDQVDTTSMAVPFLFQIYERLRSAQRYQQRLKGWMSR